MLENRKKKIYVKKLGRGKIKKNDRYLRTEFMQSDTIKLISKKIYIDFANLTIGGKRKMQNITIPTLPVPGDNNNETPKGETIYIHPSQQYKPEPQKSAAERYFDRTTGYMSAHPFVSFLGCFAAAYVVAGAYKNIFGAKGTQFFRGGFDSKMNTKEALRILELKESTLTKSKLKENHRRIMLLNHPDKGGSPYLATKVNEAKDYLMKHALKK